MVVLSFLTTLGIGIHISSNLCNEQQESSGTEGDIL